MVFPLEAGGWSTYPPCFKVGGGKLGNPVFMAASSEGTAISLALHRKLSPSLDVTLWSWDIGSLNRFSVGSAKKLITLAEVAVFVSSPADAACMRALSARARQRMDETLFLAGLMVGALGPDKVFWIMPDEEGAPSAVAHRLGINKFYFDGHRRDINAALSDVTFSLQEAVKELAPQFAQRTNKGAHDLLDAWLGRSETTGK